MDRYDMKRRHAVALASCGIMVLLTCCGQGPSSAGGTIPVEPSPSGDTSGPVTLEAKFSNVLFRPQGAQETPVPQGDIRHASIGDAVTVNNQGEAWLDFPQALTVRVYENSGVTYEGIVNPNASAAERLHLVMGAILGTNAQKAATQHVSIETQWAVITDIGTRFLVYYDTQTQLTWVVVVDGKVELAAKSGQNIPVPAGWQSWVLPNRPPAPPIPASRGVIGGRFPLIEDITGRRLAESDVLTNQQCTVANAQPSLKLRTEPDPQTTSNILDTMVNGARFEALGRLPDASWIYGMSPKGQHGWASAKYLKCALDMQLLATDLNTLLGDPMMQVTPVPNTPTPVSPTPVSPTPVSPTPVSPTPTVTNTVPLTVENNSRGLVTVVSEDNSINCPPTCVASFEVGTKVILTANSPTRWEGPCVEAGSGSYTDGSICTVTMKQATRIYLVGRLPPPPGSPSVKITAPVPDPNVSYGVNDVITFKASAHDANGNPIADDHIVWTDNIDGSLGTGSILKHTLSGGNPAEHHVMVTVMDSAGGTASDMIKIYVTLPIQ